MTGNEAFTPVRERGWQRGLRNLLRAGFDGWWRTNTWWVHTLIWTAVINFIIASIIWSAEELSPQDAVGLYGMFSGLFTTVAVIIIMQGAIVGEKQLGTAAWVLSKPVSRTAYIVSKLVPNAVGMAVTMLLIPGLVALVQFTIAGAGVSVLNFVAGFAVIVLHQLFFLTLTVMLGAMFDRRGGVIGIPLGLLFGQQYLIGMVPALSHVLPWGLVMPLTNEGFDAIAGTLMLGQAPATWGPVLVSLAATALFVVLAFRRFQRQEL
jgi:ABC-2 type transport system permease protein